MSDRLALLLAQWFGSGRAPRAPGTVGSLAALPLYFLLRDLPLPVYVGLTLGLSGLGRHR
jgi:phosphatidylglycerophosphatase A